MRVLVYSRRYRGERVAICMPLFSWCLLLYSKSKLFAIYGILSAFVSLLAYIGSFKNLRLIVGIVVYYMSSGLNFWLRCLAFDIVVSHYWCGSVFFFGV